MTPMEPNETPIGRLRLWLHDRMVAAGNLNFRHEARAYFDATQRAILAEGQQQERDISITECLDRCRSALAQRPGEADLVREIDGLLAGRTVSGA